MEASASSQAAVSTSYGGGAGGTYVLRDLIKDIPLSSVDDDDDNDNKTDAYITCVDIWNGNLYIGTSAGEVLHYVQIEDTFIRASQLRPQYKQKREGLDAGVKQILVLPSAGKACILCNGTLNFYTLPELSPAYGGGVHQSNCAWVGGIDAEPVTGVDNAGRWTVVVICLKPRVRIIRFPNDGRNADKPPPKVRDIELGGVSAIQRRGDMACVADEHTYALLDVANQRKNDLFPISSLVPQVPESPVLNPSTSSAPGPGVASGSHGADRSRSHERTGSVNAHSRDRERLSAEQGSPFPPRSSSRPTASPALPASREESPVKTEESSKQNPAESIDVSPPPAPAIAIVPEESLLANIARPTATEFLLTTGTKMDDPGVGMFVNLDGDPTRGTLEFSSYPESLVLDGSEVNEIPSTPEISDLEGYVLAIVRRQTAEGLQKAIEIQRWDTDTMEAQQSKEWLFVGTPGEDARQQRCGLQVASSAAELSVPEISTNFRLRRLCIGADDKEPSESEIKRNEEEDRFAARFAQVKANVLFHIQDRVSWVTKNPLIVRLEAQLNLTVRHVNDSQLVIDVPGVQQVINSIRGQEPRDELEFFTITYIRQKASLLLFGNLVLQTSNEFHSYERDKRFAEEALLAGDIDPRTILTLVPLLAEEVVQGDQGIWIAQGLRDTIDMLRSSINLERISQDPQGVYGENLLQIIKRYLFFWRKKKGFGSVADESHVFSTVDAALLHVLLLLDQSSPQGPVTSAVRRELNDVVDHDVNCFDRAVQLFEQFNRLYVLSRLYQRRKMSAQVLATWKRILNGEQDVGGELVDGERDLRVYLSKIGNYSLVQEYGSWLANRNPKLGVEVFADEHGRVTFEPSKVVEILNEKAPGAVKEYLEHLVFAKNHVQYVNDLIAFYLATVLNALEGEARVRNALLNSYEYYRALRPPKPTYGQFMDDNSDETEWQQNRLRLLQLIGGSHGAASQYDVHSLRQRLAPYSDELVPEMIILNGREGKHQEALRLLTHGLGDYDTAIRYCLLGGSSIFHPGSDGPGEQALPSMEEQSRLFQYLLHEFFRIEDVSERLERTAELLERFGGWFDMIEVLDLLPDSWSVELVSEFLARSFRRLVQEKNETVVVKALASSQNLRQSIEAIEKLEAAGPVVIKSDSTEVSTG